MSAVPVDDKARLDEVVARQLVQAMSETPGRELAGLLARSATGEPVLLLAPSLQVEPGTVEVPGWWLERAQRWAARCQAEIIAFVHSQATSVDPSPEDRRCMERLRLPWLIVRYAGRELHYQWHDPTSEMQSPWA